MNSKCWKTLTACFIVGVFSTSMLAAQDMVLRLPEVKNVSAPEKIPTTGGEITIDELVQMAMETNPTLLQAAARIRALQGTQLQAGLYPNPNLGWMADEMGNGGKAGRQGLAFEQEFVTNNKLCLSRATATRAVWVAQAQFRQQQLRIKNDVDQTALKILAFQERIQILEHLVEISEGIVKTTEQLFKAKEISRANVLKSQIEMNRTTLILQTARRNQTAEWQKLAGLIGRPDMPQTTIAGTLKKDSPQLTWETSLAKLLSESPRLEEADAKIEQARWNLRRECAERKSNIDLGGVVAYNNDTEYTEATLEVMMPIKIHDRNQGNIMRARAQLMEAQQNRERLCLVLHNQLAQAFREYKVAQVEVAAYRDTLIPKSKESLEITKLGFEESELSYLELLTAQHTFFSISLDYIDSLEILWVSSTEIEGLLLSGGLDSEP